MGSAKKVVKQAFIISLCFLLTDCTFQKKSNTDLSEQKESMRQFHSIEAEDYAKNDAFAAKLLFANKIINEKSYIYQYRVCFAPIRNESISIKSIAFQNDKTIEKMCFNNGLSMPDNTTVEGYFDGIVFGNINDFEAFDWTLSRKISRTLIERNNISDEMLDEYMSTVVIIIKYNQSTDIVKLSVHEFDSKYDNVDYKFGVLDNGVEYKD